MEAEDIYLGSGLLFVSLLVFASRGVRTIVAAACVYWVTDGTTVRTLPSEFCKQLFRCGALAWVLNALIAKRRTLASVALLIHVATAITLAANDKPWAPSRLF